MKIKRIVAVLLFVCLLFSCIPPVQTNAATEGYYTYEIVDGEAIITGCDTSISGDITIPSILDGYPVTTIGAYAFSECDSLTSVEIPDSVTTIGYSAFCECDSLTSVVIGDSVTTIGDYAFYYCGRLTSVVIGDSVTTIGERAFSDCDSLTGIWVDENNPNYSSDSYGVLFNKDKTQLIRAPGGISGAYVIPDSVTTIGNSAFSDCDSLTSVEIPDSVTTIGAHAFYSCDSLTSVEIPDSVTTIGDAAFFYCDGLTSVEIPDSVTTIGADAFYSCTSLTSVEIPDSVTTIGDSAFSDCDSLTSVVIGDSVTTIGNWAFYRCYSLTSVEIPDSVTTIGDYAFFDCTSLTKVIYCGTSEQWNAINIGDYNEELTDAALQYHDYVDGVCTICGHTDEQTEHTHTWENGVCTGCAQVLTEAIELSGDGKISAFDAQILAEAKAGLRELTDEQWQALGDLQVSDIIDYVLGRFPGMKTEE